jgi:hypothetical protein
MVPRRTISSTDSEKIMRLLLAVKSCQRDMREGAHQAIRDTWGKDLPPGVDVRFFMGGEHPPTLLEADEVWLPVSDDYWVLTPKTRGICAYMLQHNYDFVYPCDTDTYLIPSEMLQSGFENYDFSGSWICGGSWVYESVDVEDPEESSEVQELRKSSRGWSSRQIIADYLDKCKRFRQKTLEVEKPVIVLGKRYPRTTYDRGGVLDPFYAYLSGGVGFFLSRKAAHEVVSTSYYHVSEDMWVGQVLGPFMEKGLLKGGVLKGEFSEHLCCGFYGGGHSNRLSPAEAVRKKHAEMGKSQ